MELNSWNPMLDTMEQTVDAYIELTSRLNVSSAEIPSTGSGQQDLIPEDGLVHIDSKLARLVSIEQRLKTSRVRLQCIRNTSVTLAPINRLPVDILSMIVVAGYEDDKIQKEKRDAKEADSRLFHPQGDPEGDAEDDSEDTEAQHFPTIFSHVCRRWRNIALDTASVWSDIAFGQTYPNEIGADWIERSKQSDLTVDFFTMDEEDTAGFQQALKTLGPNVLRATSVILDTISAELLLGGLRHLSAYGRPPPLKRLKLLVSTAVGMLKLEDFGEAQWEVLMDMASGVEYLHTCNVSFPLDGPAYRGLKTLELGNVRKPIAPGEPPNDTVLLAIFQNSPELERLILVEVDVACREQEISPPPSTVVLRKLQTFSAHRVSLWLIRLILSVLSAPALERLSISDYISSESGQWETEDTGLTNTILAFFKNLQPASLKHFSLYGIEYGRLQLPFDQVLACTPELESLYVGEKGSGTNVGEGILKGMLGPERLAPKLIRLGFSGCWLSSMLLKELVLQRSGLDGVQAIQHLLVEGCQLKSEGLVQKVLLPVLEEKVEEVVWKCNMDFIMGGMMARYQE